MEILEGKEGLCGRKVGTLLVPRVLITKSEALEWGSKFARSGKGPVCFTVCLDPK